MKTKESYKHKLAKGLLKDWIENHQVCLLDQNGKYIYPEGKGYLESPVYQEDKPELYQFIFDIGYKYYDEDSHICGIEIYNTSKVTEHKIKYCIDNEIGLYEVNVDDVLNLTGIPRYVKCNTLVRIEDLEMVLDLKTVREFNEYIAQLRKLNNNKKLIQSGDMEKLYPGTYDIVGRYSKDILLGTDQKIRYVN